MSGTHIGLTNLTWHTFQGLQEILANRKDYVLSFTLIIAHNLDPVLLDQLSSFLWSDTSYPPLLVVRSAGFLADFFIQIHEHAGMFLCFLGVL